MDKIHRFPILGLLGKGGMARVFKVQIPTIQKVVALKLLWPDPMLEELMGWDALEELFTTEARILGSLSHPHIVDIWDFNTWQGRPYYLMDYHAVNLGHLIGESSRPDEPSRIIPVDRALDYTRQILIGLDRLHHSQIIHRDIKPYNVLIHGTHQIKIGDFGLSRLQGVPFRGPAHLKVGSPGYAAPEQADDPDTAGAGADIYSVGAILFRMLKGYLPEPGTASLPISKDHPDLDPVWDRFLRSALAFRPTDRFPSAAAMLGAIKDLRQHWQAHRDQTCDLDGESKPTTSSKNPKNPLQSGSLRHTPIKVLSKTARDAFDLDPLWRPRIYFQSRIQAISPEVLLDKSTGLIWQQSGCRYPCTWQGAQAYVAELNDQNWGGHRKWRLPTITELITLLRPVPQGRQLCLSSAFDTRQTRLWSVDRRSAGSAWYVDLELGFVGWLDFTANMDVRCVCREMN